MQMRSCVQPPASLTWERGGELLCAAEPGWCGSCYCCVRPCCCGGCGCCDGCVVRCGGRRLLAVVQDMKARTQRQPSHKKDTRPQATVVEARAVVCALVRCCSTGEKLKVGKRLRSGWGAVAVGTAPHTRLMCVSPWVGLRSEAAQGGLLFCCDSCPHMPGTAPPVRAICLPWQMRDVITRVGAIMRRAEF